MAIEIITVKRVAKYIKQTCDFVDDSDLMPVAEIIVNKTCVNNPAMRKKWEIELLPALAAEDKKLWLEYMGL